MSKPYSKYRSRKEFTDPVADVVCIVTLVATLILAPHLAAWSGLN